MKQSILFAKTLRDIPKDEVSVNAKYLIKGGFIDKLMAGVYTYLPLGHLVLENIKEIVIDEMDKIGGQQMDMTTLQPKSLWEETGRWKTLEGVMYKFKNSSGKDIGLAATHEEVIFDIVRNRIFSHKDLPLSLYQIQNKYRDEPRPRSGLLRGREFLMKDLYSFHADRKSLDSYYNKVIGAYHKIFSRCALKTLCVEASGGAFTENYSHEFQVITKGGEDKIVYCVKCDFAQNSEIFSLKSLKCPDCKSALKEGRSVEVGNIFRFYDKYAKSMNGYISGKHGKKSPILMASYGIGIGRLLATIVEVHHDEKGIIWPQSVAPYDIHIIEIRPSSDKGGQIPKTAEKLYKDLQERNLKVLYDDRGDKSAGEKFADSDLFGIPLRVVISQKTLERKSVEVKKRDRQKAELVKISNINNFLDNQLK